MDKDQHLMLLNSLSHLGNAFNEHASDEVFLNTSSEILMHAGNLLGTYMRHMEQQGILDKLKSAPNIYKGLPYKRNKNPMNFAIAAIFLQVTSPSIESIWLALTRSALSAEPIFPMTGYNGTHIIFANNCTFSRKQLRESVAFKNLIAGKIAS